ncbi:YadA family autotransporter adhesin [Serratia symbiotica]|uniref:YadA family autotransporter adhesin n=1 Tax=Serratia symbiotica TaxID=138074 RepID=UPI001CEFD77D|nr:YadA-like family protein [Serratia symbiotica]
MSALAGTCIQINEIDSDSVMGSGASVPTECDSHSIAIGGGGGAAAKGWGIAIGNKANATGLYSHSPMALGTEASALGDISIAMGNRAKVDENAQQGTAIGASSVVSGEFGMAIGQRAKATNRSYASVAIGESALVDGSFSAALGPSAEADGPNTIALGYYSHAKGINSLALGSFASATGNYGVAIGNSAKATGNKSISIGFGNRISGNGSGAIGEPSTVSGSDSYSLGNNNTIGANNAFAIGHNITIPSNLNGAIALGDASTVDASNPTPSTVLNGINYSFAGDAPVTGGVVSVGKAGAERQLTHMAAGRLSDTSTDGVNGSQLFATNTEVNKLGTRMANIEAAVSDINASNGVKYYRINSSRVDASASGTDSLAMGAEATASGNNAVAMGSGAEVQANDSVVLGSGASDNGRGAESYMGKYSGASNQSIGAVYFGNAVMGETRTINNVADGRLANDAVNVRQLDGAIAESKKYTDDSIAQMNAAIVSNLSRLIGTVDETNITALQQSTSDIAQVKNTNGQSSPKRTGNNSLAAGAGAHSSASNSTGLGNGTVAKNNNSVALGASSMADRDNSVSVGSKSHERQITHVAAVTQGTDAVNYDQLKSSLASVGARSNTYTDKHVNNSLAAGTAANSSASKSTGLGNGTVAKNSNSVALGASSMVDRNNSVSVGSKGHERQITHVAAATQGTDAVNYDQLKSSLASVGASSNAYTDKRVNQLRDEMARQNKRLSSGIASVIAMANLPQPVDPDASMISMGVGTYHSESGLALGISHRSENERWVTKASVSTNTQGDWSLGIGTGYQF